MRTKNKNAVGILGCGWLGLPLAKSLVNQGYDIHGSTTQREKLANITAAGAKSYIVYCDEKQSNGLAVFLEKISCLVLTLPPGIRKNPKRRFDLVIENILIEAVKHRIQKVVFISSTSVYGNSTGTIDETTAAVAIKESGKQLLRCEQLLLNTPSLNATILRFGGLIGPNRHPVFSLAARKSIGNPTGKINFIHLDDCLKLISLCLDVKNSKGIFNGVTPYHPSREEYYQKMAAVAGVILPPFESTLEDDRIISSQKAINHLGMHFKVDNLLTLN